MKMISVITANSASSVNFVLQLAKLNQLVGRATAILPSAIFSDFLYQYPYDLVEISGIRLAKTVREIDEDEVCLHIGYLENADIYLLLLEHNLYSIRHLLRLMKDKKIENAAIVLLDSISDKLNLDYIAEIHFKDLYLPLSSRFSFELDELDQEQIFFDQLAGEVNLHKFSKERKMVFLELAKNIMGIDGQQQEQLKKSLKIRRFAL